MDSIKENRDDKRYSISGYLKEKYSNIYIEIMADEAIRANVIDVSMSGLGFEIELFDQSEAEKIEEAENFFIKIYIGDEVLIVETKKIWNALLEREEARVLKGGLMFSVISPKDRLDLFKYIEGTRKRM